MLSDIEIAQQTKMNPIGEVAASLAIADEDIECYGHYKAKLSESLFQKLADKPDGKLVLVTAINPTPAGEGKTTISVGLSLRESPGRGQDAWQSSTSSTRSRTAPQTRSAPSRSRWLRYGCGR